METKPINTTSSRQFFFSDDLQKDLREEFIYILEGILMDYRYPVADPLPVPSQIEFELDEDNHCFKMTAYCYDPLLEKDARQRYPHLFEPEGET